MKNLYLLLCFASFGHTGFSQAPAIQWEKTYGGPGSESGISINKTRDLGYVIMGGAGTNGGQVSGNHGGTDCWVVKTDSAGTLQWQHTYGGTGYDYAQGGGQQTRDGGYIVAAISNSHDGNVTGNHGKEDYWIFKTDSVGTLQWQKSYGGDSDDVVESVQQVRDGGYIMVGDVWGAGGNITGFHGRADIWVIKLDSVGNLKWQKALGGSSYDFAQCVKQTNDGGYIVTGWGYSNDGNISGNHGSTDAFVIKLDSSGNVTWQKSYGGSNGDGAWDIEQTTDGGYILGAFAASTDGQVTSLHANDQPQDDIWILKLNSTGDIVWQRSLGGSRNEATRHIHQTLEGGYIVVGTTNSYNGDVRAPKTTTGNDEDWVVKLDAVGNIEWEKALGGVGPADADEALWVLQNADSSFVIGAQTYSNSGDISGNHGGYDIAIFKLFKSPPPCLTFSVSNTNFDCTHLLDTTTIHVTQGTVDSISWGDGTTSGGLSLTTTHVYSYPGIYTITLADPSGCLKIALDTLVNFGITIDSVLIIHPSCDYSVMGQISVAPTGGIPPYSYIWNTNATTASINNLTGGNYSLTVSDNTGCLSVMHYNLFKLTTESDYYVRTEGGNPNCGNNGTVNTVVHNGREPFTYVWNTNATTAAIGGLSPGNYAVTVTDSLGCVATGGAYLESVCYNLILGNVFNDINSNCIKDSGEIGLWATTVVATDNYNHSYYGLTILGNGNYYIEIPDTGIYTLSSVYSRYGPCGTPQFCSANSTVHFTAMGDTSFNNDFGIHFSGYDLGLKAGWGNVPPCYTHSEWQKWYFLSYFNQSPTPIPAGPVTITFQYDTALNYIGFLSPPPTTYNAATRTLTYVVDSPGTAGDIRYLMGNDITFTYRVFDPGYQLRSEFWITPVAGDCDSTDNHFVFIDSIFNSHDPNDKRVEPANTIAVDDSVLTYTINFQNTGNDTARFIIVKDTLSANLDPAGVRTIATSPKYSTFNLSGPGILTWLFDPANLPDSLANPETSQGFIKFQVMKKKDLQPGTVIGNRAAIYFDYNAPVFTNTITDTVTEPLAIIPVTRVTDVSVRAFPNPFSHETNVMVYGINEPYDFELYEPTGRLVKRIASVGNNIFQLTRDELASGVYLYSIKAGGKNLAYGKLVVE